MSSHELAIEVCRYNKVALNKRICQLCDSNTVEDQYHFIMTYPLYNTSHGKLKQSVDGFICLFNYDHAGIFYRQHMKSVFVINKKFFEDKAFLLSMSLFIGQLPSISLVKDQVWRALMFLLLSVWRSCSSKNLVEGNLRHHDAQLMLLYGVWRFCIWWKNKILELIYFVISNPRELHIYDVMWIIFWKGGTRRAMPLECSRFWVSLQAGLQARYGFHVAGEPPDATRDLYVIMVELCVEYSQ